MGQRRIRPAPLNWRHCRGSVITSRHAPICYLDIHLSKLHPLPCALQNTKAESNVLNGLQAVFCNYIRVFELQRPAALHLEACIFVSHFLCFNLALRLSATSHLTAVHANLQLDSFNRTGSRGSGKLSRLFSGKKSPRTQSSPSPTNSQNLSPASMGGPVSVAEMLTYQNVRLHKTDLLKVTASPQCDGNDSDTEGPYAVGGGSVMQVVSELHALVGLRI